MSEMDFKHNDILLEQREHENTVDVSSLESCPQPVFGSENTENKFVTLINPVDTPPLQITEVHVIRPSHKCHIDWFKVAGNDLKPGLYWHALSGECAIDIWIAGPIIVEAITSDYDGREFGRLLRFQDINGCWHKWSMPMRMLSRTGEDVLEVLLDQGFIFIKKKRSELIDYLMMTKPSRHVKATSRVGWHNETFVLPHKSIGPEEIIFQSESRCNNDFQSKGTVESWNNEIGSKCKGNKLLMAVTSTALAGVLFKHMSRHQGGGIHLVGDSSNGKSTCIEVGGSVWGPPCFMRSWSATANGLEGVAATRNDTCLILDEIDEALPTEISKITYMVNNGQGKQRATKTGQARATNRWRTMVLSSGERTLSGIMAGINKQPNSGQLVRLINFNAHFKFGVFEDLHGFENGREFADHLKKARSDHYGTIGPKFIEHLLQYDPKDINQLNKDISDAFKPLACNNLESRAASTCELIALAGELAIEFGLFPWDKGSVVLALIEIFSRWKNSEDSGRTEDERILGAVGVFLDQYADLRFTVKEEPTDQKIVGKRAGWYNDSAEGRTYMIFGHALVEACGNYQQARIAQTLKRCGWIVEHDNGRLNKKTRVGGESKYLYYIKIPCEPD